MTPKSKDLGLHPKWEIIFRTFPSETWVSTQNDITYFIQEMGDREEYDVNIQT